MTEELELCRKECNDLRERLTDCDERAELEKKCRFVSWVSLLYAFNGNLVVLHVVAAIDKNFVLDAKLNKSQVFKIMRRSLEG